MYKGVGWGGVGGGGGVGWGGVGGGGGVGWVEGAGGKPKAGYTVQPDRPE